MISRYLSLNEFGELALGLTLFYVFQVVATAGLPNLLTRETAKHHGRTPRLIANGLGASGGVSVFAALAMASSGLVMQYDTSTTIVIAILSCGLVPYALALVLEAGFRGNEQMHFIAYSNVIANVVKLGAAFFLLQNGYGIYWIAGLIAFVRWLIFVCDILFYLTVSKRSFSRLDVRCVKALLRHTSTFLGVDVVIACWSAVEALLLSKLMSPVEVGLYCCATQLLQPVGLVYRSIVGSVFPAMCRKAKRERQQLYLITRWMVAFLLLVGLPTTVLIPAFADVIIHVAYAKPEYQGAVPVMQIVSFAVVSQCFTVILGHALWAADRERDTLRIVVLNLIVNVIVSFILISTLGLLGAALGTLVVGWFNVWQHYVACKSELKKSPVDRQVLPSIGAALALAAVTWGGASLNRYVAAGLGVVVYVAVALALLAIAHGGTQKLRRSFFAPLLS